MMADIVITVSELGVLLYNLSAVPDATSQLLPCSDTAFQQTIQVPKNDYTRNGRKLSVHSHQNRLRMPSLVICAKPFIVLSN